MFIIFNKTTKTIYSHGSGTPEETGTKLYLDGRCICNDLSVCDWKKIADQRLEQDENGFVRDADYYDEDVSPSYQDQIDAILELI